MKNHIPHSVANKSDGNRAWPSLLVFTIFLAVISVTTTDVRQLNISVQFLFESIYYQWINVFIAFLFHPP